jgi:hypothetical protein
MTGRIMLGLDIVFTIVFILALIGIFMLGFNGSADSKNYNTNCLYSHSDATWDYYDCDNGFQMKRLQ